ncbi:cell division protein ZapE [Marinobacterium lutimaris]|uniref:Cell division protein ZapE n=1 Tax=Marinobacterium lutimaris TaxID=568106 RepID=A0A1H5X0R8_9GAMM|nr:cell division protein ZapE [Marinobacterium lutimaris]SEG05404.1 cell division protein ZapE [Marinobacterium lutimaris]
MSHSPRELYLQALENGFTDDPAQRQAVEYLERCFEALHKRGRKPVPGVYLYGPVGRGKTWLMDSFHQGLDVPARRQHFHHFMRSIHRRLFELTGHKDALKQVADELAEQVRVLCLDELFINDIGDAMILGRLFQLLFANRVTLVLTSNSAPDRLYEGGHHRDRLFPAIEAIKKEMEVVDVLGSQDHRLHPGAKAERYWVLDAEQGSRMESCFHELAGCQGSSGSVRAGNRNVDAVRHSSRVLWATYDQLCEANLWANDYIELCDSFRQILVSEVPCLVSDDNLPSIARGTEDAVEKVDTGDRQLPYRSKMDNGVRRFIALVDECYDRGVPLYIEAEVPMEKLYPIGYLEFAFRRTLSRLNEMQLARFGIERTL